MIVIIPAAGIGSRFADPVPKQYHLLDGKPILQQTIERLLACRSVASVMVAVASTDRWFAQLPTHARVQSCTGGASRAESVWLALQALRESSAIDESTLIAVHDGVRPLFSSQLMDELAMAAQQNLGGAIAAVPVTDTVKQVVEKSAVRDGEVMMVQSTLPRESLWLAQTPQVFNATVLLAALSEANDVNALDHITDDASAVEQFTDYQPVMVRSDKRNLKITTPDDLQLAHYYWSVYVPSK